MDLLRKNRDESDVSFLKRKAYFQRIVLPRLEYGKKSFLQKSYHLEPVDSERKETIKKYWSSFCSNPEDIIDFDWYEIYNSACCDKDKLHLYMPETFYYAFIDEYFSNPQRSNPLEDKNLNDLYFHDIQLPQTIFHKTDDMFLDEKYEQISKEEAIKRIYGQNEVVLKQSRGSYGGKGLLFWNKTTNSKEELTAFIEDNEHLICQDVIRQHNVISRLNPSSINTIRIMTLCFEGIVYPLSCYLRMGAKGSRIDNATGGGLVCGINENGNLKPIAYDQSANVYHCHPQGLNFQDITVPDFQTIVNTAISLAKRLAGVSKLISWDFAVAEDGSPVLIESNLSFGGVGCHQLCNGPIFGDLTDKVLKEVFAKSYTLKSILKSQ